jgi:hypothetical protein
MISLRFFRLHPKNLDYAIPVVAVLNSTVFALLREVHGRRGLGEGALETGLVDILPLPFPILTEALSRELSLAIDPLLNRGIDDLYSEVNIRDRRRLDEVVLKAYGLDPRRVEELHESVIELTRTRLAKAENFS